MENIQQLSAVIRCRGSLSKGSPPLHNLLDHNNLFDCVLLARLQAVQSDALPKLLKYLSKPRDFIEGGEFLEQ